MKLFILLSFLTLFSKVNVAQSDTINKLNENNEKHGYWIFYNDNNQKVDEGKYVNGKKEGLWKGYYDDGKIKQELTFKENKADGYAKFYYPTGIVSEEGIWKGNKWVGQYKYFHPNGNVSYDWSYSEQGKRTGVQKYYHENGKIMIEGEWNDGKESGVLKEYDDTGKLIAEKNFADGKLDASSVKIFNSSTQNTTENNSNNENIIVKENNTNQNSNVGFFDGNGYNITKTKDGKKDREGEWKNGRLIDGKRYHYDEEGKLVKTSIYKGGNIVNIIYP
ncbi:MAG: hypothetical protein CVU05_09785 [Bacteroidetes bacterium HGW-Bacteroidetes-21]|jgi:antitoxin component YwqK of YwqJK toxin-antitoxin module|nr:MAG: hypothetical protein CVU05_09785 [Bacteroidetes bacterium HGW-Bacteroidetes-21]